MKYAVIDIESTGLSRFEDKVNYIGVGLAKELGQPLAKTYIFNMYEDRDLGRFKSLMDKLKKRNIRIIYQNGKFDTLWLEHAYGVTLPLHEDVMVMGTAYDMAASHALDDMAQRYVGADGWDIPLREKIKPNNPIVEEYLEKDLKYPWELYNFFVRNMTEQQMKIYRQLLMKAYRMYRNVERNGIYFDKVEYEKVKKLYKAKEEETLKILTDQYDINWRSPDQVSNVLFNVLKLPTIKLSQKTGKPSSDAKVLKRLASQGHKIAQQLLDYKFYYGANSKFLNQWGNYAKHDGRIHPKFGITNVVTGRTSCSNPNLQQVPRNKELRRLFSAPPGSVLIEADYSQIELRIAADYADEDTMIEIYKTGGDIHTKTAMGLTGLSAEEVHGEPRSKAKAVNFGFLYGMSAKGFVGYAFDSYNQVFTPREAAEYREKFFRTYSKLQAWHQNMAIKCEMDGGVFNRFGQFRSLPDIYAQDMYTKSSAIRRAINTPVQGTASVLLMLAAYEVDKKLGKKYGLKVVGTVHDAILAEVPEEYSEQAAEDIKTIMASPKILETFDIQFKIPIVADVGIGPWGEK